MSYHIIWQNPDGSLKVTNMHNAATLADASEHKDYLIGLGESAAFQAIVTSPQLPQERYFRPAWRFNGVSVTLDIPACRQRHIDKLRRVRNVKLQDSDADYMRALEQANQTQLDALKNYRQALRDMPQAVNTTLQAAATPEAIKAIRPAILDTLKP